MIRFFELAVVGPVAGPRFGLADACEQCSRRNPGPSGECRGFGAGCLGVRPAFEAQADSSRIKR